MKAVILAGGLGSRLSEETEFRPKPMVKIGGRPILWHILQIYSHHGVNEFVIALGYKSEVVKEYFLNFFSINNDISVDLGTGETTVHSRSRTPWKVHLIDTGMKTMTGGRLKRLRSWVAKEREFCFTYGDGVANLDIRVLLDFHRSHGKLATMTTVRVPERFGRIAFEGRRVAKFYEKPEESQGWINGGFFVLSPEVLEYIDGDETIWEREPVQRLTEAGELMGYQHSGFWSCMDTLKEKHYLETLWESGQAPWKIWA